jgi:hypothetical protein
MHNNCEYKQNIKISLLSTQHQDFTIIYTIEHFHKIFFTLAIFSKKAKVINRLFETNGYICKCKLQTRIHVSVLNYTIRNVLNLVYVLDLLLQLK